VLIRFTRQIRVLFTCYPSNGLALSSVGTKMVGAITESLSDIYSQGVHSEKESRGKDMLNKKDKKKRGKSQKEVDTFNSFDYLVFVDVSYLNSHYKFRPLRAESSLQKCILCR
jgi:hypothetical protein